MATVVADAAPPRQPVQPATTPPILRAVLFASCCVLIGVVWDISWHQSIGRDTFFSPPHLAIYLGGVVAGLACGWVVLRASFGGGDAAATVSFWRFFRGPLGAWVSIWGAIAMLTSAPFDDWWHGAYGLDVKILSPPHALLAAGIGAISLGALLMAVSLQNRATDPRLHRRLALYTVVAAGLFLLMDGILSTEFHYRIYMHLPGFYVSAAIGFPVVLTAAARAADVRWPALGTALVYSAVTLLMMWILPLFPAEPRLAPINVPVTRMVPPSFPLLLVVPALAIDLLLRRWGTRPRWQLALAAGLLFGVTFVAAQWPFAEFLMSDAAQNPIFAGDNFPYQVSQRSSYYRRVFVDGGGSAWSAFGSSLVSGSLYAIPSAWVGLFLGDGMRRVRR